MVGDRRVQGRIVVVRAEEDGVAASPAEADRSNLATFGLDSLDELDQDRLGHG